MPTFTVDAVISYKFFTLDAVILGNRLRHYRDRDHAGTQDDTTVVLAEGIGQYPAGTTVHDVLLSLDLRLATIGSTNRHVDGFKVDAFIQHYAHLNAVIFRSSGTQTFTADAWFAFGGSFTINAVSRETRGASFTANAAIV